ncbi:MAG: sigma 54-interacting transcriptional regulator [Hyphomonadaceae bacterium]|nr:sigma 54-interacting transcriptional regulator [Hyphomonadaceae bacterium]
MTTILLADDDSSLRFVLSQALTKEGYTVRATGSAPTLAKWVRDGEGDLVLSDVYLGEDCVFDTLPTLRAARPNLPVITMSAQSTVATALSANSAGAYDYLAKPFDLDALLVTVRRALTGAPDAQSRAQANKAEKEEKLPLIGRSPAMQEAYRIIARVAGGDLTVVIEGETGAGKGRVARALHDHGRRSRGPFLAYSLAGAAPAQLEAELGAKLAAANGGTLFLEDVDGAPLETQTRLVALLQSNENADVRLIAAVQRPLDALVRSGAFRQDLFYRLNVVSIRVPPLRDRLEDVPDLARAFMLRAKREGLGDKSLNAAAIERLKAHDWPGNVRELENLLKRLISLTPAAVINAADIDRELVAAPREPGATADPDFEEAMSKRLISVFAASSPDLPPPGLYDRVLAEVERPLIRHALKATKGNQIRAAAVLGINRNTLRKKIQTLGLATGRGD